MILMVEHYVPSDPNRVAELNATLQANMALGVFDEILPVSNGSERLRYGTAFRLAAERFPGLVCVLANADIQFDWTARLLPGLVRPKRLVTLTRWENNATPRMIGHVRDERFYSGSQDVWAWEGGEFVGIGDAIPLGYIGCDQAICGEFMKAGYEVVNPALSIRTYHNHANTGRGPDEQCAVGTYAYPELTTMAVTGKMLHHEWPENADSRA